MESFLILLTMWICMMFLKYRMKEVQKHNRVRTRIITHTKKKKKRR